MMPARCCDVCPAVCPVCGAGDWLRLRCEQCVGEIARADGGHDDDADHPVVEVRRVPAAGGNDDGATP